MVTRARIPGASRRPDAFRRPARIQPGTAPEVRLGLIGTSPGNGHPYSFSAIVNGYDGEAVDAAGWGVIRSYLDARPPAEFGLPGVAFTHVWTQSPVETARLQAAAGIPTAVPSIADFAGAVDAVVLARDDHARHAEMALPLLEAGLPVFVDKPLTASAHALRAFRPYLEAGRLMSCSGFRYARELDEHRGPGTDGTAGESVRLARGAVLYRWRRYGIHLLEALCAVLPGRPEEAVPLPVAHDSLAIRMSTGALLQIDALGDVPKTFQVDLFGGAGHTSVELVDNFTAFRRTLRHFTAMVRTGTPAIDPAETLRLIQTLIAGHRALESGAPVRVDDVRL